MPINENNKMKLGLSQLPEFTDIISLADEIRLSNKLLYFLIYCDDDKKYKKHVIKKRNGNDRVIYEPCLSLKIVQRWILDNILYRIPVSSSAMGFKKTKGSPLKKMAQYHNNNLFILKIDICDFFPSISDNMIFNLFRRIGYGTVPSGILTRLCSYNGELPQGAVTSPAISNLVAYHLDRRLIGYTSKHNIVYSRYADDMYFSCNNRKVLKDSYYVIKKIVESESFELNDNKTRMMSNYTKKEVIGITINDGMIKVSKELKKKVRAMIHHAICNGDYSQKTVIEGYISYINSIEDDYTRKIEEYIHKFYSSDVAYCIALVELYNNNKFLKHMDDMMLLQNK